MAASVIFDPAKHEYRDDMGVLYPSVTQIIKQSGRCFSGNYTEDQANRGTSVHWMTALEDQGALSYRTVPKKLRGYRRAWISWKHASGFVTTEVELPFISEYGYAGTADRTGMIRQDFCVVDLKSGSTIPAYTNLQLVAYGHHIYRRPVRRIAVRVLSDGTYRVKEYPLSTWATDWATFVECLRKVKSAN